MRFDYDRNLPLDPHEHEMAVLDGTRLACLDFAVTPSAKADGLLITPPPGNTKTGAVSLLINELGSTGRDVAPADDRRGNQHSPRHSKSGAHPLRRRDPEAVRTAARFRPRMTL